MLIKSLLKLYTDTKLCINSIMYINNIVIIITLAQCSLRVSTFCFLSILCFFSTIITNRNKYISTGESEDIETYLKWIELYFAAKAIPQERRVPLFLMLIVSKTYSILINLPQTNQSQIV